MHPPAAFLITGIPGAGKTTVSALLARRFPRAAHIEADRLQRLIVSGARWPDQEPHAEAMGQLELRARNAAVLAGNFAGDGFVAVVDDVIVARSRLDIYAGRLAGWSLHLVVLAPALEVALARDAGRPHKRVGRRWAYLDEHQRTELADLGLWIDTGRLTPAETVDAILSPAGLAASRLPRIAVAELGRASTLRARAEPAILRASAPRPRSSQMTTDTQLVSGVDFVAVPTRDLEAAREFYGTTLGLPGSMSHENFAEFETGNLTLSVIRPDKMGIEYHVNRNAVALHVDDVATARATLEERGVEFQGDIFDTGVCHMAFFADPDGNALMLHHRYAPRVAETER